MKLKKNLKTKGKKTVVAKPNKTEKKKENESKLKDAEKVMASFVKGSVPIEKKQNKQKNGNGNNNTANNKGNPKEAVRKNGTNEKNEATPKPQNTKKQLKKILTQDGLLVKHQEGTKWYSYQVNEQIQDSDEKLSSTEINNLLNEGKDILAQDSALLQTRDKQENGSEASWLYSVIAKGTAADKRTAMQLQMHKSPIHSLEYIEKFISSAKKQGTRDVIDIIPILEEAFVNHCLPENRKLVPFNKRKLTKLTELSSGNERTRRKILLLWAYEHEVKILYQQFIETLVEIVKRPLEDLNKRALRVLANCLSSRPESENLILSALVNSFGHPNYKVGSHVVYLLEDIIRKHPAMRTVIAEEIERLVFRKNVNERAHLYSLTFLSQLKFSTKDSDLACKLMKIYLSLFKTIVGKKVTDSRLLPIVLAGANRAFPYAKDADKLLDDVKDIYFLAHNSNYRTAIPALKLLFQFHKMNEYVSDRYYNALYRKLLDNCPSAAYAQLLKLMFDTMKEDPSAQRVRAFVKRLLQVAVNVSSEFAASILLLISKLKTLRKDEQLVVLSKDADPTLRVASKTNEEDDDEERYVDLDAEGNEIKLESVKNEVKQEDGEIEITNGQDEKKKPQRGKLGASSSGGWVHRAMNARGAKSPYDPIARNPLFVDASQVADSELLILSNHFHPSVAVFAKCLMEGGEINYGGDSLNDFALMNFLDRFAFRNPKEVGKSGNRVVRKKEHDPWGVRKLAVNSNDYMKKKRDEIPADERFLHRYTSSILGDKKVKKEENNEDDWEYADSVNSEEFDAILERFEPGELNEEFDIDYSKEFSAEKNKRNKKAAADDDVDEDEDDLDLNDLDDEEDDEDDGDEANEDDIEDDDDEDDIEDDDDEDDEEGGGGAGNESRNLFGDDDISSDEELGENDYELAGDQFAEMLEELEEEEENGKKNKKKGGKGVKRPAKRAPFKSAKKPRRR